jgi:DNA end-binding protein Ku
MSTMRFADEVIDRKDVDGLPARRSKPAAKELRLATQIIDSLASDWEPGRYRDTYEDELKARIKGKAKGGGKQVEASDEGEGGGEVLDLMAALERSVADAKRSRSSSKPKKRAARTTRRKSA